MARRRPSPRFWREPNPTTGRPRTNGARSRRLFIRATRGGPPSPNFVWRPVSHSLPERFIHKCKTTPLCDGGSVKIFREARTWKPPRGPAGAVYERTWRSRCHNVDARSGTGCARAVSALGGRPSPTAGESAGDPTPSSARGTGVSGIARASRLARGSVSSWLVARDSKLRGDGQGAREGGGLPQGSRR